MQWFRVYGDMVHDPKVQNLPPELFKGLINLWCVACLRGGQLPVMGGDNKELAHLLHMRKDRVTTLLNKLIDLGLIDRTEKGLEPHNWRKRQYKSDTSNARVQRYRDRHRNDDVTLHETELKQVGNAPREQSTDSERKEGRRNAREGALRRPDWPTDYQIQFWNQFPNRVGKADAFKKLDRLARSRDGPSFADLMAGLFRYAAKTDDRPWCNPSTWLNQARWLDQPSCSNGKVNGNGRQRETLGQKCDRLAEWVGAALESQDDAARGINGHQKDALELSRDKRGVFGGVPDGDRQGALQLPPGSGDKRM